MKVLMVLLAVLLASGSASAQVSPHRSMYSWAPVSASGPTPYIDLRVSDVWNNGNLLSADQTVDVTLGAGTNAACTWQLEGSNDLVNWYSLSGSQACTAPTMVSVVQRPTSFVRINVLTYTGTAPLTFNWVGR